MAKRGPFTICIGSETTCKADLCLASHGDRLSIPDIYKGDALDFLRKSFLPKFSGDSNTTKQLFFRHVIVISGLKLGFEGISEILAETSSQLIDLGKHLKDSINQREIPKDSAL